MKILLVNDYSEQVGGTEIYIQTLVDGFKNEGHKVITYYGSDNFNTSFQSRQSFISYIKRIFNFHHLIQFRNLISREKPDIIHLHNIFNEITPSILLVTQNIPVIMTIHDYQIVQSVSNTEERTGKACRQEPCPGCVNCIGFKGMIYEKIKRTIHRPLLKKINLLIAPSKWCQSLLEKSGEQFNIKQLYNGFNFSDPFPYNGSNVALYSGRLTRDKGVEYLIQAIPKILQKVSDFQTIIVGDGELKEELAQQVKTLQVGHAVYFTGKLERQKAVEQYNNCSIVIVPSTWPDNLPTVCIEALSLGKPVIASNIGGIPEIVKDKKNGRLVEKNNSEALATEIISLLKDKKELKKYSREAVEIAKIFNVAHHMNELLSIYSSQLNGRT